jgi:hypothetical protein
MHRSTMTRIDAELLRSERELAQLLGLGSRGLLNASLSDEADMDGSHRELVFELNRHLILEMAELSIEAKPSDLSVTNHDKTESGFSEYRWTVQLDAALFGMRIEFCLWYGLTPDSVLASGITLLFGSSTLKDSTVTMPRDFHVYGSRDVEVKMQAGIDRRKVETERMRNVFEALYYIFFRLNLILEISAAYDRWQLEVRCAAILAKSMKVDLASSIVRESGWKKELPDARHKISRIIFQFLRRSLN